MYFSDLNLRPLVQDNLGPWDLRLNKLGKGPLGNVVFESKNQHSTAFWYPENTTSANLKELCYAILNTKFQASEPGGSEEDFLYTSMHFYVSNLGPPGLAPSWILGPLLEQTW